MVIRARARVGRSVWLCNAKSPCCSGNYRGLLAVADWVSKVTWVLLCFFNHGQWRTHFSFNPRPNLWFISSGSPGCVSIISARAALCGPCRRFRFIGCRAAFFIRSAARAGSPRDGQQRLFSRVLSQPLRRRCDFLLPARKMPSGRPGALRGYHEAFVFSGRGAGSRSGIFAKARASSIFFTLNHCVRSDSSPRYHRPPPCTSRAPLGAPPMAPLWVLA